MKITFLIPSIRAGGSERQFIYLANELINKGIKVLFIVYKNESFHDVDKIDVHLIKKKYKIDPFFLRKLISKIKDENSNILITCYQGIFEGPLMWGRLVKLFLPKLRLFSCYRNSNIKYLNIILDILSHHLSEKLVVNNIIAKNKLIKYVPRTSHKTILINNIADEKSFYELEENLKIKAKRKIFHTHERKFIFCIIGTYSKVKNHIFILKFVNKYKKYINDKNLFFSFFGVNNDKNSTYNHCKNYFSVNNLNNFCSLNGPTKEVNSIINAANCVIIPSLNEGTPNIAMESLLTKTPVLISKTCNHSNLVINNKTGFEFEINNLESLKLSISKIVSPNFKFNIDKKFFNNYNKKLITNKYLSIFGNEQT